MIEIKSVRDLESEDTRNVSIPYKELVELLDYKIKALRLYGKLEIMVLEKYVENYACFGNGGAITYEELAELLNVELPIVKHVGVERYLEIKKEVRDEREKEERNAVL